MVKKENCEQLQEEKPLEEMFAELDLLAVKTGKQRHIAGGLFYTVQTGHGTFETLQREAGYSGEENAAA